MNQPMDLLTAIGDRIFYLQSIGLTGKEIAQSLRDEGFPLRSVQVALTENGFYASIEPFLDLKGLHVSDFPLLPGEAMPIYSGARAAGDLTIWLQNGGAPSSMKAHLN